MSKVVIGVVAVAAALAAAAAWFVFGAGTAATSQSAQAELAERTSATEPPGAAPSSDAASASERGSAGGSAEESGAQDDPTVQPSSEAPTGDRYVVVPAESEVGYAIDEVLRGEDTTAVGATSEVAGEFTLRDDAVEVGPVVVNARTLATDQPRRDQTVRGRILQTDAPENEFIEFAPTETSGVPQQLDQPFEIDVTGELTISGVTNEQTFPLTVTPEGDGFRLTGRTIVSRAAYDLQVPSVPIVADVGDEVELSVDLLTVPAPAAS